MSDDLFDPTTPLALLLAPAVWDAGQATRAVGRRGERLRAAPLAGVSAWLAGRPEDELMLVVVDQRRLEGPVMVADLDGEGPAPWLACPVNVSAATDTARLRRGPDGQFALPDHLIGADA